MEAVVATGGAGVGAAGVGLVAVVSVADESPAESGGTGGLALTAEGSGAGSFSGGGVGSEGFAGALGSSAESAARRLLKDVGKAEAAEPACGTEKAALVFDSGGLNKLPVVSPLDKSVPADSSVDFCRPAPKLNCGAPLLVPSALSPKENEAGVGLAEESLESSPWPTRSPEKLPRVSPPMVLGGCGSILRAAVAAAGLAASPGGF